jgi:hypothetical protein
MLPLHREEKKAYTNQQAMINAMTRSNHKQPPARIEAPPDR